MKKAKKTTFRLTSLDFAYLEKHAKAHGVSVAQVLRWLVKEARINANLKKDIK